MKYNPKYEGQKWYSFNVKSSSLNVALKFENQDIKEIADEHNNWDPQPYS